MANVKKRYNNEKISLIGKRNATSESLETSKMFTQVGLKNGDYYLRFATAIKVNDNLDNISTLNYTRIIEDNTKTAVTQLNLKTQVSLII